MAKIAWRIWSSIISAFAVITASPATNGKEIPIRYDAAKTIQSIQPIKSEKPLLFLQQTDSDNEFFAGHRSHRSHSSHSSHSSHRSGSYHRSHVSHTSHTSHYSASVVAPPVYTPAPSTEKTQEKVKVDEKTVNEKKASESANSIVIPKAKEYYVIFKNGNRFKTDSVWVNGDQVMFKLFGGIIGYPKTEVEKVIEAN